MRFFDRFRKKNDFYNVRHPDFKMQVEEATKDDGTKLKVNGIQYYRFKPDHRIPYGRYTFMQAFLLQYDLRMDLNTFTAYLDSLEKHITGQRGELNVGKAYEIIQKMRARAALAFDPTQAYNLASVVYFDDQEVLYGYDMEYNKKKIALWREAGAIDFFYTRPLSELLGLNDFSEEGLTNYIQGSSEILNDLISGIT